MTNDLPALVAEYVAELESNNSGALVAVFDRYGYYLYASTNHVQVIGYTAEDLLNMHLADIVERSGHHAAWVLRTISVLYASPMRFSARLVAKSGEIVPIKGTLRHLHEPGGERYFVTCVRPERP